ncbi:UNVERIFIED_CONTAM: protein transport protein bos1 [Siphonaria sp. JEL0065]|nr:protein transport protein bos1 [Siphonaria sp. JEL0065]
MSGNLIFNNASKVLQVVQTDLDQMQSAVEAGATHSPVAGRFQPVSGFQVNDWKGAVHSNLEALRNFAKDLADVAKREITTVKREKALLRANQMQADYQSLKFKYDDLKKRMTDVIAERDRAELMGKAGMGSGGLGRRVVAGSKNVWFPPLSYTSTILMMDGLLKESDVLQASEGRIDEFIQMGRGALSELYEQRQILKSTQKRMYDIATSLGLSSTVIKYIEKRAVQDRWILFGGMFVTVLLMWAIVHFFGKK